MYKNEKKRHENLIQNRVLCMNAIKFHLKTEII